MPSSSTLGELAREIAGRLAGAGIDRNEARLDAELLLRETLGWDRATWLSRYLEQVPERLPKRLEALVERRTRREPMAYILGHREFWVREFTVTPAVLIPRPETELLVEQALARLPADSRATVLDAGTGSGCIAVTLALERPGLRVIATDASSAALEVARANAVRHRVSSRIAFQHDDLLGNAGSGWVDMIVSNPPYVPISSRGTLQPEVTRYEPETALFAGDDGLDVIRTLVAQASGYLSPGAWLIFEFGWGQDGTVRELLRESGAWVDIKLVADLQGIPRVANARRAVGLRV